MLNIFILFVSHVFLHASRMQATLSAFVINQCEDENISKCSQKNTKEKVIITEREISLPREGGFFPNTKERQRKREKLSEVGVFLCLPHLHLALCRISEGKKNKQISKTKLWLKKIQTLEAILCHIGFGNLGEEHLTVSTL